MSQAASPSSPAAGRLRPGLADVIFLVLAIGILRTSTSGMLDDPGLGWHIRNIDAMREQGGWLRADTFSGPSAGNQYFTNQWLGDAAFWAGDRGAGLTGIAVVTTLVLALTLRLLFCMLLTDGLAWPLAAVWTYLAALGISSSWVARPNIFTILFMLITVRVCGQFHRGLMNRRQTLWLLPLFAVWANTHGGFVAGLITLAASTAIELGIALGSWDERQRADSRSRVRHWILLTIGAAACTLINPYGYELYPWVFRLLGDEYFMNLNSEWLSPNFHLPGAFRYELLMLLLVAILPLSRRPAELFNLGLALVWLHFAYGGWRYVPLWVVVAVPMLARASAEIPWLVELVERAKLSDDLRRLLGSRNLPQPILWTVLLSLALLGWARFSPGFAKLSPERIPAAALDRLLEQHSGKTVLHDYNWGGYLIWRGWDRSPRFKSWIDDRNEVHGRKHTEDYFTLMHAKPGWEKLLEEGNIGVIAIVPDSALAHRLAERSGWKETHRDNSVVMFTRL